MLSALIRPLINDFPSTPRPSHLVPLSRPSSTSPSLTRTPYSSSSTFPPYPRSRPRCRTRLSSPVYQLRGTAAILDWDLSIADIPDFQLKVWLVDWIQETWRRRRRRMQQERRESLPSSNTHLTGQTRLDLGDPIRMTMTLLQPTSSPLPNYLHSLVLAY
jgi:hypothetical protein